MLPREGQGKVIIAVAPLNCQLF
uniref:Uncharacterized protein n=1 Tax=Rhizophora mucronata TaxID=61149 RepID=A0A2P2J358_RHIMU